LLIFAKYLPPYLHNFTYKFRSIHTQAHIYNQHTKEVVTTRHKSLVERGEEKLLFETKALHTHKKGGKRKRKKKMSEKSDIHEFKEKDSNTYSFRQSY